MKQFRQLQLHTKAAVETFISRTKLLFNDCLITLTRQRVEAIYAAIKLVTLGKYTAGCKQMAKYNWVGRHSVRNGTRTKLPKVSEQKSGVQSI